MGDGVKLTKKPEEQKPKEDEGEKVKVKLMVPVPLGLPVPVEISIPLQKSALSMNDILNHSDDFVASLFYGRKWDNTFNSFPFESSGTGEEALKLNITGEFPTFSLTAGGDRGRSFQYLLGSSDGELPLEYAPEKYDKKNRTGNKYYDLFSLITYIPRYRDQLIFDFIRYQREFFGEDLLKMDFVGEGINAKLTPKWLNKGAEDKFFDSFTTNSQFRLWIVAICALGGDVVKNMDELWQKDKANLVAKLGVKPGELTVHWWEYQYPVKNKENETKEEKDKEDEAKAVLVDLAKRASSGIPHYKFNPHFEAFWQQMNLLDRIENLAAQSGYGSNFSKFAQDVSNGNDKALNVLVACIIDNGVYDYIPISKNLMTNIQVATDADKKNVLKTLKSSCNEWLFLLAFLGCVGGAEVSAAVKEASYLNPDKDKPIFDRFAKNHKGWGIGVIGNDYSHILTPEEQQKFLMIGHKESDADYAAYSKRVVDFLNSHKGKGAYVPEWIVPPSIAKSGENNLTVKIDVDTQNSGFANDKDKVISNSMKVDVKVDVKGILQSTTVHVKAHVKASYTLQVQNKKKTGVIVAPETKVLITIHDDQTDDKNPNGHIVSQQYYNPTDESGDISLTLPNIENLDQTKTYTVWAKPISGPCAAPVVIYGNEVKIADFYMKPKIAYETSLPRVPLETKSYQLNITAPGFIAGAGLNLNDSALSPLNLLMGLANMPLEVPPGHDNADFLSNMFKKNIINMCTMADTVTLLNGQPGSIQDALTTKRGAAYWTAVTDLLNDKNLSLEYKYEVLFGYNPKGDLLTNPPKWLDKTTGVTLSQVFTGNIGPGQMRINLNTAIGPEGTSKFSWTFKFNEKQSITLEADLTKWGPRNPHQKLQNITDLATGNVTCVSGGDLNNLLEGLETIKPGGGFTYENVVGSEILFLNALFSQIPTGLELGDDGKLKMNFGGHVLAYLGARPNELYVFGREGVALYFEGGPFEKPKIGVSVAGSINVQQKRVSFLGQAIIRQNYDVAKGEHPRWELLPYGGARWNPNRNLELETFYSGNFAHYTGNLKQTSEELFNSGTIYSNATIRWGKDANWGVTPEINWDLSNNKVGVSLNVTKKF